jgi:hypothetical protein
MGPAPTSTPEVWEWRKVGRRKSWERRKEIGKKGRKSPREKTHERETTSEGERMEKRMSRREQRKKGTKGSASMDGIRSISSVSDIESNSEDCPKWDPETTSDKSKNTLKLGGRLQDFVDRWQKTCGGTWLLNGGFRIFWESTLGRSLMDASGPTWKEHYQKGELREAMRQVVKEALAADIIVEISPEEVKWVSPSYVIPKAKGGYRQIMDLRALNRRTKRISFKMEDASVLTQIARTGDYATSLDVKSAFNHIPTNPSALPYLSFLFEGVAYAWKGMPFGARHSPLIFTKIMKVVLSYIRKRWQVRCVGYMDDLLFLHQKKEELRVITAEVAEYMSWLGWILSMDKCELEPKQEICFLGWIWNFGLMNVQMKKERKEGMKRELKKWLKWSQEGRTVPVRALASLLGKVNFLRTQFPRVSLYTAALNKAKVRGVKRNGWNGTTNLSYAASAELKTILRWICWNTPRAFQTPPHQAILTTDASAKGWGAVLTVGDQELFYHGDFMCGRNPLSSSNQRESRAVLCALSQCQKTLLEKRVAVLMVESDNTTTVSNLSKVRAAKSMLDTMRRIFSKLERLKITVVAKYRPGVENGAADAMSRLERAGDYELSEEAFYRGLKALTRTGERAEELVEIDVFASSRNTKLKRFISPTPCKEAEDSDGFSVNWEHLRVYAHPPISMINKTLKKMELEKVQGILVVPNWPSQPWWPIMEKMAEKKAILGSGEDILIIGKLMKALNTKLPPGEILMVRISSRR